MAPEGFKPQFSKLGLVVKMTLQVDSPKFIHSESIEIDENYYNDPTWINGLLCYMSDYCRSIFFPRSLDAFDCNPLKYIPTYC
jgi:hypothetical protein